VNNQSLSYADLQERENVHVSVIDRRKETGGVSFVISSSFNVPNPDPVACGDADSYGVATCSHGLVFLAVAIGELQREAACTETTGVEWTGTLEP
jgi:hypothetical protein